MKTLGIIIQNLTLKSKNCEKILKLRIIIPFLLRTLRNTLTSVMTSQLWNRIHIFQIS